MKYLVYWNYSKYVLNSAKEGREERKLCLHFDIFLELKLLGLYFKGTFHLEEYLKVKEKYTYQDVLNEIAPSP